MLRRSLGRAFVVERFAVDLRDDTVVKLEATSDLHQSDNQMGLENLCPPQNADNNVRQ